jgi:prolipoprotein diacylglyceryltransferase
MLPIISIGPMALPTYPFSILLACWVGMWLTARRANSMGLDGDHAYNAGLYSLLAGIVGARLWFVLAHWNNYAPDIWQAFSLSRGALAAPEGVIIAALVGLVYLQRRRVPLGDFFDAAAPALALALAIISVGAFLGGVNPGAPTDRPWAVDLAGTPRHPVQLYEAVACLFIVAGLSIWSYRPWPGFQFWLFVALYAVARLGLEVFVSTPALTGDGFLTVQLFALTALVTALAVMAHHFTQPNSETNPETYEV